ncbi:MAG: BatD family protein [Gemmatimonadetes bacterium]|nr:BatD family protein [Gemmatimonadota bacterium]
MSAALLLAIALQGVAPAPPPPEVTASVNRTRLRVGDELTLTVRARSRSIEPVELVLPLLSGFALVGSRDLTEVSLSGADGPVRTTVRELLLRAERAGTVFIGPVRARQGDVVVDTDPITLTVDSTATGAAATLGPLARGLLESAPLPARNDQVALTVIIPDDTVLVGQQVDMIAAAWFPRELRNRLRRLPVVVLATPERVWAYPQPAPTGIAASRLVDGRWMDLFAVHTVVFPLAQGRVVIPPVSVTYAVPVSFSFFSREERYTLRTDSAPMTILPLPAAGRPADDQGVVGQGLTLDVAVTGGDTRVGEPMAVSATVTGMGNIVLWPEPVFRWPAGFRTYPAQTAVRLEPRNELIGGSKTFRYLVVPDSAGSFVLPEVRYPYYDIATGRYAVPGAAPRALAVEPGVEPRAARALPPLTLGGRESWTSALARGLTPWGWIALAALPPALLWLARRRPAPGSRRITPVVAPQLTRLGRLEREFQAVLAAHVPDTVARDGDGLAQALRAAGVESAVAEHVMRLRDRLRAARYGPQGVGDAVELAAETEQVLRVLGVEPLARRRRRMLAGVLLALCLAPAARAALQGPTAEGLYEAGALRAAADSFAARAARQPRVAAHWYNLGATLYRAGADGKAVAAWTIAARLAPRDLVIRRSRRLLPPPDAASEPLLAVGVATTAEWALVAAASWLALWVAALARRRRRVLVVIAGLTAGATLLAAREGRRARQPLAVAIQPTTAVRVAPHGRASATGSIEGGAAVLVVDRYGRWLAVRRRDGLRGWVLETEVVRL